jgi:WhiB family transcriptional regulator, redox-sensing transcriptional regulator
VAQYGRSGPVAELWQWQDRAACRDADPELFFYPDGERGLDRKQRQQAAAAICMGCVVRAPCRAYALAVAEPHGVWGGLSESARDAILGRPAAGRAS